MTIPELEEYVQQRKLEAIKQLEGSEVLGMKLVIRKNQKTVEGVKYSYDSLVAYKSRKGKSTYIRVDGVYTIHELEKLLRVKIEEKEKYHWILDL